MYYVLYVVYEMRVLIYIYIYIYIHTCVSLCVCVYAQIFEIQPRGIAFPADHKISNTKRTVTCIAAAC